MSVVQQYLRESDNAVLFSLDDSGNVTQLGASTQNSGQSGQAAAAGVAGSTYPASQVITQEFSLTSANLLALRATPMQLVPAPGAGKYIRVTSYELVYTFNTAAYTSVAATLKLFQGTTANAVPLTADLAAILANVANAQSNGAAPIAASDTIAKMQNTGIFLGNDGAAELAAGSGTLKVILSYKVVTP